MIDYSVLLNPDIEARTNTIGKLGYDIASKITVPMLRQILNPYMDKAQRTYTKPALLELYRSVVEKWELARVTLAARPLEIVDGDCLSEELVKRWIDLGGEELVKVNYEHLTQNRSIHTQKSDLTLFRKICDRLELQNLKDWSYHYGRDITAASNNLGKETVNRNLSELVPVAYSTVLQYMQTNKATKDWKIAVTVLGLATGRRMIELLARGTFNFTDSGTFIFNGQAKLKSREVEPDQEFPIWNLTGSECQYLFNLIEPKRLALDCGSKEVNNKYSKLLAMYKPELGIPDWKFKTTRDLYCALIIHEETLAGSNKHPMKRATELLGHGDQGTGIASATINYQKYRII
jgi:hypothetical protein